MSFLFGGKAKGKGRKNKLFDMAKNAADSIDTDELLDGIGNQEGIKGASTRYIKNMVDKLDNLTENFNDLKQFLTDSVEDIKGDIKSSSELIKENITLVTSSVEEINTANQVALNEIKELAEEIKSQLSVE